MPTSTALPELDPIVPLVRAEPFDGAGWLFEPRTEGVRGLLYAYDSECEIRAPGVTRLDACAPLCARLREVLDQHDAILDGELVSLDAAGRPDLRELLRGRGFPAFAAYDLLWLDGRDLRDLPLEERKGLLTELLPLDTAPLYKVFTLPHHGRALFEAARNMGLEGILAKRASDPYRPETLWFRIRNPEYRGTDLRLGRYGRARVRRPGGPPTDQQRDGADEEGRDS